VAITAGVLRLIGCLGVGMLLLMRTEARRGGLASTSRWGAPGLV
jgi:hypothetical protein